MLKKVNLYRSLLFLTPILLFFVLLSGCSSYPPDELFTDDINRMVMIEEEMGFSEKIDEIKVIDRTRFENRVEIEVRVTGWATHPDLTIGATLPAAKEPKPSWAAWKYFCRKQDKNWIIEEKFKVAEGFN